VTNLQIREPSNSKGYQTSSSTTVFDPSLPVTGEMCGVEDDDEEEYILPSIFRGR